MARNIVHYGRSGSVRWTIDKDGTMLFRPVSGDEGTLAGSKWRKGKDCREWEEHRSLIKRVEAIGTIRFPEDSNRMFDECYNLETIDLSHFETSKMCWMRWMFSDCPLLTDLDFSRFDMRKPYSMEGMFYRCRSLKNLNLSGLGKIFWNNTNYILDGCDSLSNLVLSEKIDKITDNFMLLVAFFDYIDNYGRFNQRIRLVNVLLEYFEKFLNTDLSEEKELLRRIQNPEDLNGISLWKSRVRLKKVHDILKIFTARNIDAETLKNSNFQMLVKEGVVSDINAYLNGVPLADILA